LQTVASLSRAAANSRIVAHPKVEIPAGLGLSKAASSVSSSWHPIENEKLVDIMGQAASCGSDGFLLIMCVRSPMRVVGSASARFGWNVS